MFRDGLIHVGGEGFNSYVADVAVEHAGRDGGLGQVIECHVVCADCCYVVHVFVSCHVARVFVERTYNFVDGGHGMKVIRDVAIVEVFDEEFDVVGTRGFSFGG